MSLVFDNRANLHDRPALHALIVGVSEYVYLPGGNFARPENHRYGLYELSACALTAYSIYRWLLEQRDSFPVPLASIRLLLAPLSEEKKLEPELNRLSDSCTVQSFLHAATDWRADARLNRDSMTLFYFTGHGMYREHIEPIILLADFGDIGPALRGAVSMTNLYEGMAPSDQNPDIARTQLYFLDCSQRDIATFDRVEYRNLTSLFDLFLTGLDDRAAPIFYAAPPGGSAWAIPSEQTLFGKALLECLNGAAGDFGEVNGAERWYVSVISLTRALPLLLKQLTAGHGVDQEITIGGSVRDAIIHFLSSPPPVGVTITLDPPEALQSAIFTFLDEGQKVTWSGRATADQTSLQLTLPAGYYDVRVRIDPPKPGLLSDYRRQRLVLPPHLKWTLIVRN